MVGFYLIISISMNVFTISVWIPIEPALLIKKAVAHSTAASFFRLKPNFNQLLNAKERKTMVNFGLN